MSYSRAKRVVHHCNGPAQPHMEQPTRQPIGNKTRPTRPHTKVLSVSAPHSQPLGHGRLQAVRRQSPSLTLSVSPSLSPQNRNPSAAHGPWRRGAEQAGGTAARRTGLKHSALSAPETPAVQHSDRPAPSPCSVVRSSPSSPMAPSPCSAVRHPLAHHWLVACCHGSP
jgi:hypothetical protein